MAVTMLLMTEAAYGTHTKKTSCMKGVPVPFFIFSALLIFSATTDWKSAVEKKDFYFNPKLLQLIIPCIVYKKITTLLFFLKNLNFQ